jgi:RNA polymerase sigma factor (sigma-70 family)
VDKLADEGDTIEEQVLRLETHRRLRQALAELSPEQKWVLQERYFHHRTLQEIAAETGVSRQAIHLRERKILRTLRRKLSAAA